MEITAKFFEERVGRLPVQDDLERCNCPHAGKMLHWVWLVREEEFASVYLWRSDPRWEDFRGRCLFLIS